MISSLITLKVLHEKVLNDCVLESSRDRLQECAKIYRVFHLKKLKWPSRDLQMTLQGQTNGATLWLPKKQTTFVENFFSVMLCQRDNWDYRLKWLTVYIYIYVNFIAGILIFFSLSFLLCFLTL